MKNNKSILFVIGWPLNHGGHIHSTLNHVKYLIRNGQSVILLAPEGKKVNDFIELGVRYHSMPNSYFTSVLKLLFILLKNKIKVVHAMDYKALKKVILIKIIAKIPIVFTKAGGTIPKYIVPPVDALIVFSKELQEGMGLLNPFETKIHLIKERIDLEVFHKLNLQKKKDKVVFMAMRLEPGKAKWIHSILNQITTNKNSISDYKFIFAGNGTMFDEFVIIQNKINIERGRKIIEFIGAIENEQTMNHYYNKSDIIIGHGRGILEAMASGKDVVIVGENNEVEKVTANNISTIEYFNFSGRHFEIVENNQDLQFQLKLCTGSNDWNMNYISNEYDAAEGAKKMTTIYDNLHPKLSSLKTLKWIVKHH